MLSLRNNKVSKNFSEIKIPKEISDKKQFPFNN